MRPITITFPVSGASFFSQPIPLDTYTNPQVASIIANTPTSGGSGTLGLQVSNDDPFAPGFTPASATWLTSPSAFSNSGAVTPTQPVSATLTSIPRMIRFSGTLCVGSPTILFKIVQAGIGGA